MIVFVYMIFFYTWQKKMFDFFFLSDPTISNKKFKKQFFIFYFAKIIYFSLLFFFYLSYTCESMIFMIGVLPFPVEIVHCTRSDTGSVRWWPYLFIFFLFIFRPVINYFNWWKAQWKWSEIRKKKFLFPKGSAKQ